jgi:hypothetical protein
MKVFLLICCIVFANNSLIAQFSYLNATYNPNNTWSAGLSIIEYNGSYYLTGATSDSIAQYQSIFIANIDAEGNLNFWKTYGGYPYAYWSGYSNALISTTSLGELVLAGSRSSSGTSSTATYYNFQSNGDTNFTVQYPDTNYLDYTVFHQCKQTFDGGFIFVGKMTIAQYNGDILLLKTDHSGNEEWRKHYGKPITWAIDHGYNILETADSGYLIGYYFYVAGQQETGNPYVLKVDKQGNYEWEINFGGPYEDLLVVTCHTNDGNYMCAASISDSASGDNLFTKVNIFKISSNGGIIWSKTIGDLHLWNKVHGIYQDHNGGYILCGYRHDFFEDPYQFLNSRGWICKIDENGDSVWWREYKHFTDPEWNRNELYDLHQTTDGGYVAIGQTATIYDPQQTWLIRVDSFGCDTPDCQTVDIKDISDFLDNSLSIYPNPAINEIHIKIPYQMYNNRNSIIIYDIFGRKQDEIIIAYGERNTRIDISSYSSGVYIAVARSGQKRIGRAKFIVN